ncbi:DUF1622 domain-containing protein [Fortiea contorta]|uniref:DUF1622 domain-containing protein n=1 Tax=Fortiea contorta TaxID=1892405 RepID=UPI000344FF71|nr:DUF1622 domain-containing protein [Fortiea contorta]
MNLFNFSVWAAIIQLLGAMVIGSYAIAATISLLPNRNVDRARLLIAQGVITSLSLMVAATLLKTIYLRTWKQILIFSVILALRIFLKKLFVWERGQILALKSRT